MGRMVTITGWGSTNPDYPGVYPDELQEMNDGNVPISKCPSGSVFGYDDIFCSGRAGSTIGICKGDSGGPVTINVNISHTSPKALTLKDSIHQIGSDRHQLVGVASIIGPSTLNHCEGSINGHIDVAGVFNKINHQWPSKTKIIHIPCSVQHLDRKYCWDSLSSSMGCM